MAERKASAKTKDKTSDVDDEAIRRRAFEISQGEDAGSEEENWQRAEAELRGVSSAGRES